VSAHFITHTHTHTHTLCVCINARLSFRSNSRRRCNPRRAGCFPVKGMTHRRYCSGAATRCIAADRQRDDNGKREQKPDIDFIFTIMTFKSPFRFNYDYCCTRSTVNNYSLQSRAIILYYSF